MGGIENAAGDVVWDCAQSAVEGDTECGEAGKRGGFVAY